MSSFCCVCVGTPSCGNLRDASGSSKIGSIKWSESFGGGSVTGDCVLLWPMSSVSSSMVDSRLISEIFSTSVIIGAVAGMSGILQMERRKKNYN